MLSPWVQGKVTKIIQETNSTRRFFIEVAEWDKFDFTPGQFVTLDLPIHEVKNKRWRSYSIASWPNGTNTFELVIVLLEGGAGTTYLFNHINEGDEITLRGALGKFVLPQEINEDLYFVCTGTGIAPFRSMANHIINNKIPHKNIYLIFGCRKFEDGLYIDEMNALQAANKSFYFMPTYSRETEITENQYKGYVHAIYEKLIRSKCKVNNTEEKIDTPPAKFFLCGWENMVNEAKERITKLGYDKKSIHLELYG